MQQNHHLSDEVRVSQEDEADDPLPEVIGSYRLGKTLGKGTFGKVKEAVHLPTN